MNRIYPWLAGNDLTKTPTLTYILHLHAEQTISEEQIKRLLLPIHKSISEDEFRKIAHSDSCDDNFGGCPEIRSSRELSDEVLDLSIKYPDSNADIDNYNT